MMASRKIKREPPRVRENRAPKPAPNKRIVKIGKSRTVGDGTPFVSLPIEPWKKENKA